MDAHALKLPGQRGGARHLVLGLRHQTWGKSQQKPCQNRSLQQHIAASPCKTKCDRGKNTHFWGVCLAVPSFFSGDTDAVDGVRWGGPVSLLCTCAVTSCYAFYFLLYLTVHRNLILLSYITFAFDLRSHLMLHSYCLTVNLATYTGPWCYAATLLTFSFDFRWHLMLCFYTLLPFPSILHPQPKLCWTSGGGGLLTFLWHNPETLVDST